MQTDFIAKFRSAEGEASGIGDLSGDLRREPEERGNESCFRDHIFFIYPSNSSLPNHVNGLDALECSPRTLKSVVALGQPGSLFDKSMILLNHIVEKLALAQANSPRQRTFLLEGPNGSWIGGILVHIDHARNGIRRAAKYPLKEAFRRSRITFGREQESIVWPVESTAR